MNSLTCRPAITVLSNCIAQKVLLLLFQEISTAALLLVLQRFLLVLLNYLFSSRKLSTEKIEFCPAHHFSYPAHTHRRKYRISPSVRCRKRSQEMYPEFIVHSS